MSSRAEMIDLIQRVITQVAPDVEVGQVDLDEDFRDELELDSMDLLNIVIGLVKATGIEIPDADANKLLSINAIADYLIARQ